MEYIKHGKYKEREGNMKDISKRTLENYQKKYFYSDTFTYVGSLINSGAIKSYGFTDKSFFVLYDDTEHSLKLSKFGKMICVTFSHIFHGSKSKSETKIKIKLFI
jgi:GT2 family glycosyltransferase